MVGSIRSVFLRKKKSLEKNSKLTLTQRSQGLILFFFLSNCVQLTCNKDVNLKVWGCLIQCVAQTGASRPSKKKKELVKTQNSIQFHFVNGSVYLFFRNWIQPTHNKDGILKIWGDLIQWFAQTRTFFRNNSNVIAKPVEFLKVFISFEWSHEMKVSVFNLGVTEHICLWVWFDIFF